MPLDPKAEQRLLSAISKHESGDDPNAIGKSGEIGKYQFMPITLKQLGADPKSVKGNAALQDQLARKHLSTLSSAFGDDQDKIIAAWNAGVGGVKSAVQRAGSEDWRRFLPKGRSRRGVQYDAGAYLSAVKGRMTAEGEHLSSENPTPANYTPGTDLALDAVVKGGGLDISSGLKIGPDGLPILPQPINVPKPATSQTIQPESIAQPAVAGPDEAARQAEVEAEHGAVPSGPAMVPGQEVDVTGGVVPGEEEQAAILAQDPAARAALEKRAAAERQRIPTEEARSGERSIAEVVRDAIPPSAIEAFKKITGERAQRLKGLLEGGTGGLTGIPEIDAAIESINVPAEVSGDAISAVLQSQGVEKQVAENIGLAVAVVGSVLYGTKSPTAFGGRLAGGAEDLAKAARQGLTPGLVLGRTTETLESLGLSAEELMVQARAVREATGLARDLPAVGKALGIEEAAPKGTPVFHGTGQVFDKADVAEGLWVAEKPKTAGFYAAARGEAPNIRPYMLAPDAKIAPEAKFNYDLSQADNADMLRRQGFDAVFFPGDDSGKGKNYLVLNPEVLVERFTGETAAVIQKLADDAGTDPRFAQEAILAARRLMRENVDDVAHLNDSLIDSARANQMDVVAPSLTDNEKGLAMAGGAAALLAISAKAEQEGGVTESHIEASLPGLAGNRRLMKVMIDAVRRLRQVPGKVQPLPPATAEQSASLMSAPLSPIKAGDKLLGIDWVGMSQDADNLPNTIKQVQKVFEDAIKADSRGVVSHEMERQMAKELVELGFDSEVIVAKWKEGGRAVVSTEIAATTLLTKAAYKEVERTAAIANRLEGNIEALEEHNRASGVFSSLAQVLSGQGEEAGRALGVFRAMAGEVPKEALRFGRTRAEMVAKGLAPGAAVEGATAAAQEKRRQQLLGLLDAWNNLPKSQQRSMFLKELGRWGIDLIKELWYSNLLLTFPGQLANLAGSAQAMLGEKMAGALGVGIGAIRHDLLGIGPKGADLGEITESAWYGMTSAITEAFVAFGKSFVSGQPHSAKVMGESLTKTPRAMTGERVGDVMALANVQIPNAVYHGINALGMTVGIGTRTMLAVDDWWKIIGFRDELYRLGYVEAQRQGKKGDDFGMFMKSWMSGPPSDAVKTAKDYAHYITYTNPLTGRLQMASRLGKSLPMLPFTPFFDTLVNIFKYEMEWMPGLNMLIKKSREDMLTPGPRQDKALAKIGIGSAMLYVGHNLYMNGYLSGPGPSDKNLLRDMKDIEKYEPWSFIAKDKDGKKHYYGINRLDPGNFPFILAAAYGDISLEALNGREVSMDTAAELMLSGILAVGEVAMTRNYLEGWSQALEIITSDEIKEFNKLQRIGQRIAGQVVPSGLAQINRSLDENMRAVYSAADQIYSRLPGASKNLFPSVNIKGEPRFKTAALGPDWASPIPHTKGEPDPVVKSFLANGVSIEKPGRSLYGPPPPALVGEEQPHHGIIMSPAQQYRYEVLAGNGLKRPASEIHPMLEALGYKGQLPSGKMGMWDIQTALLKSKEFTSLEPATQGKVQRAIVQGFRKAAGAQLLKENQDLREKFFAKVADRAELFGGARARAMAIKAIQENDLNAVLQMTGEAQ